MICESCEGGEERCKVDGHVKTAMLGRDLYNQEYLCGRCKIVFTVPLCESCAEEITPKIDKPPGTRSGSVT